MELPDRRARHLELWKIDGPVSKYDFILKIYDFNGHPEPFIIVTRPNVHHHLSARANRLC